MGLTENARITMNGIVDYIEGDGVEKFVEKNLFLRSSGIEVPAMKWSSLNKLAVLTRSSNLDCRGFHQWSEAGRKVKKGAHAAYILIPLMGTPKKNEEEGAPSDSETVVQKKLYGYRCQVVFPSDQTEGDPLPYEKEGFDLTKLPLKTVADYLGIRVAAGLTANSYGFFRPADKEIVVGTDDITTWFHEFGHAIDNELPNKSDDYNFNEVVAELTSSTLCKVLGYPGHMEHTKAYVKEYQGKGHIAFSLAKAVGRVGEIFDYIFMLNQKLGGAKA